ncbi:MXAN_6230/SCO0854 family RING domain-containing protein [Kribbella deserti]|uniref:MXAN_6230/SCO0854 family RING domain-containing protein n=1 Tax=Kribbella deserti TaxID=1926257 RepID=A0ABV6QPF0_9ACTN
MQVDLAVLLLRRGGLVAVDLLTPKPGRPRLQWRRKRFRDAQAGMLALEGDLIQRGLLPSARFHHHGAGLPPETLAQLGKQLLELVDAELGAVAEHVPLFRGFPDTIPADTEQLYVDRVFARLMQEPEQPCVLCGEQRTVFPVSPCAHLVCANCWDGADYGACPICHRRIDPDDPFLQVPAIEQARPSRSARPVERLRLLTLSTESHRAAAELATALVQRQTPLSAQDRRDLIVLMAALPEPDWLPATIPVRETRVLVLAWLLAEHPRLLDDHLETATDVLRLLYVLMGADPGLQVPPVRRQSLPRATRRLLLAALDRMPPLLLAEDVLRHREVWKRMAEALHPFEFAERFPVAALAFAVLRQTRLDASTALGRAVLSEAVRFGEFRVEHGRVRLSTFATRVEAAFAAGHPVQALAVLRERPGELARRVIHLARALPPDSRGALVEALTVAASDVSPAVLIAVLGQLRTAPEGIRLFFPKGGAAPAWAEPDYREPLPGDLAVALADVLTTELLRRASALPRLDRAFLDEGLADLAAPGSERGASASLVRITRGSAQTVPRDDLLRLFLHWVEPEGTTVDLDLSVAIFDEQWDFLGLCDYTNLRFEDEAAIHSGDLTSAPSPLGASEFVDLDLELIRSVGGRYVMPVVFSYNNVPFGQLVKGFAGVMRRPNGLFDPGAVEQRFDLSGPAKILLPFAVDLWSRRLRWYDLNLSAAGFTHQVAGYAGQLARLGDAMEDVYASGHRVSLWELCCWHAAARANDVVVRCTDGSVVRYTRAVGEDLTTFAQRLTTRREPDRHLTPGTDAAKTAGLVAVIVGDVEPPPGADVYALYPRSLDATEVTLIDPAGLLAQLTPDARARITS